MFSGCIWVCFFSAVDKNEAFCCVLSLGIPRASSLRNRVPIDNLFFEEGTKEKNYLSGNSGNLCHVGLCGLCWILMVIFSSDPHGSLVVGVILASPAVSICQVRTLRPRVTLPLDFPPTVPQSRLSSSLLAGP